MTSFEGGNLISLDTAIKQQPKVVPKLPSKRIQGISSITVGLVGTALVLSGCAQSKLRPEQCQCKPPPSRSSCDVADKKSKEKFLKIALRLHKIHTEAMELANELDLSEKAGDVDEETKKRKSDIKIILMNSLLKLRKYKEIVSKNTELHAKIISVEDYLKRRIKDHFGN